jgi:uncharacterized protein YaiI (UPF0178 family)
LSLRLFIDGDACPVKAEALRVAERHKVPVVIVSNGGIRPSRDPMVTHIVVAKTTADAADDKIVEEAAEGDVTVTADIRLAARLIEKDVQVIGPTGRAFTKDSIGMALAMRDLSQHLRETGESRGFNASFTPRDRSRFLEELDRMLRRAVKEGPQGP